MALQNKSELNKLFKTYLDEVSSDENSDMFLREEGLDPDKLVEDGLRKIKQIKMNIAAEQTQGNFLTLQAALLAKAKAEAERLMTDVTFNFQNFIKQHGINVAYRNFDELTKEEIKEFLERHLMLKFDKEKGTKPQ